MEKPYRAEFYSSVFESSPRFIEYYEDYEEALENASEILLNNEGMHVKFYYQCRHLGNMF